MPSRVTGPPPRVRWALAVLAVLAFAALLFAVPAGRRPFWSSDEARFALLAQDILDHGRWLVPEIRGQLYLNKPQLYFWSIAAVSLPAGRVTEITAAIPSVVSALATVAAVGAIARLAWGPTAGLLAGLILASTPVFFLFSHQVLSDVMMVAWMTWALYCYLRAAMSGWPAGPVVAMYVCVGAAVLSKGPAGFASLAAVLVATLVVDGRAGLRGLRPGLGLVVLGLLMLPWIVPYLLQSDGRFTDKVLLGHYRTWYFGSEVAPRLRSLGKIVTNFLPWTIFLAASLFWWRSSPDAMRRRIGLATLTLAIVMSLSAMQRARYALPVYPGLALLTAEFLAAGVEGRARTPLRVAAAVFGVLALGVAGLVARRAAGFSGEDRAFTPEAGAEVMAITALATLAALAAAWTARRPGGVTATATMAVAIGGILLVQAVTYPPRYARDNDVRPLAAAVASHTAPDAVVVAYPDLRLSYDFYIPRRIVEANTPDAVVRRLLEPGARAVLITTRERWASLAPGLPPTWRVVASRVVADREVVVVGSTAS
jgi:4-amino-4-deoxy-L-arabinose transferase-like glycosyltransferase